MGWWEPPVRLQIWLLILTVEAGGPAGLTVPAAPKPGS